MQALASPQHQLVQLPNGQMAYAAAPQTLSVQHAGGMFAMPQPQAMMMAGHGGHPGMQVAAHHGMQAVSRSAATTLLMSLKSFAYCMAGYYCYLYPYPICTVLFIEIRS